MSTMSGAWVHVAAAGVAVAWWGAVPREGAWQAVPLLVMAGLLAAMRPPRTRSAGELLAVAAIIRVIWLTAPLHGSDDLFRYLWEGRALLHGLDPWSTPPAELTWLDPDLAARVNHPDVASAYPPGAMLWFVLLQALGGSAWVARLASAAADVGLVALLLRVRPDDRTPAAVWAVHPLAALESAGSGHLEAPALLLLGLAVASRPGAARATWWLASVAMKLLPILVAPALLRDRPTRRIAAALVLAAALGWAAVGGPLPIGLSAYAAHWSFNGAAFTPLRWIMDDEPARRLLMVGGGGAVVWAAWRRRSAVDLWVAVTASFVLLSPTAHPWYTLWVMYPALWAGRRVWATVGALALGSYLVLASWDPTTSTWTEAAWLWPVTWGVSWLALLRDRAVHAPASVAHPTQDKPPPKSA